MRLPNSVLSSVFLATSINAVSRCWNSRPGLFHTVAVTKMMAHLTATRLKPLASQRRTSTPSRPPASQLSSSPINRHTSTSLDRRTPITSDELLRILSNLQKTPTTSSRYARASTAITLLEYIIPSARISGAAPHQPTALRPAPGSLLIGRLVSTTMPSTSSSASSLLYYFSWGTESRMGDVQVFNPAGECD